MTDLRRKQKPIVEGKVISGRTHVSLCTCPLWFLFSSKKKKFFLIYCNPTLTVACMDGMIKVLLYVYPLSKHFNVRDRLWLWFNSFCL